MKKQPKEVSAFLKAIGEKGGKSTWEGTTPEERSKEMSRRRLLGLKNRIITENK